MSFDLNIKKMLKDYPDTMSQTDKLREILQQTALLGLARHHFFEHAGFYGGTALRILYGLDRYSEDLDFSLLKPNPDFFYLNRLHGTGQANVCFGFYFLRFCSLHGLLTIVLNLSESWYIFFWERS